MTTTTAMMIFIAQRGFKIKKVDIEICHTETEMYSLISCNYHIL